MWLPEGWWIITEKSTDGTRFTAGAKGLPEIESSAKFRSDRDATGVARKALRSMAYENQDSGWSKFRCHARLPGQLKAFCGARIENSPNTKHAYSEPCGKCERIVESIPDPDEAENDIKKHFRYVSFNSERNPEVNSKGEDNGKPEVISNSKTIEPPPPEDYSDTMSEPVPTQPHTGRVISDKQRKRMYAIARNAGMNDEQFKQEILRLGFSSSADVTMDAYEDICTHLESFGKV